MCSLANSDHTDEMLHNATFHQGLNCLIRQTRSSEKEIQFYLEIITCDPLIHTINHFKCVVSSQKERSIRT